MTVPVQVSGKQKYRWLLYTQQTKKERCEEVTMGPRVNLAPRVGEVSQENDNGGKSMDLGGTVRLWVTLSRFGC